MTRKEFRDKAKPINATIDERIIRLEPKEFKTLSLGWHHGMKATLMVGNTPVRCQVGINITIIGSKQFKSE